MERGDENDLVTTRGLVMVTDVVAVTLTRIDGDVDALMESSDLASLSHHVLTRCRAASLESRRSGCGSKYSNPGTIHTIVSISRGNVS